MKYSVDWLTHFSTCTGFMGIDYAGELAGFKPVGQVEKNTFCQQLITKHYPDVPGWSDLHNVTEKSVRKRTGLTTIDLLTAGPTCTPFSKAGHQQGTDDDRDLWPEVLRVIGELRPTWFVGENVANFSNMALGQTVTALENKGYTCRTFEIPAVALNAEHRRMRTFIVGNTQGKRRDEISVKTEGIPKQPVGRSNRRTPDRFPYIRNASDLFGTPICREDHGIPDRMDRIAGLGRTVCPEQIYPILRGIAEIEWSIQEQKEAV